MKRPPETKVRDGLVAMNLLQQQGLLDGEKLAAASRERGFLQRELQMELTSRLRRVCVWGSSLLNELAFAAADAQVRMHQCVAAASLARQDAIKALGKMLKQSIEEERTFKFSPKLLGNEHEPPTPVMTIHGAGVSRGSFFVRRRLSSL